MSTREHNTPRVSLGFPRQARITRGAELQRIAQEGKRIRTRHLDVRAAASPFAYPAQSTATCRVGFVVPRYKHSAVARNLVKRRLRELVRIHLLPSGVVAEVVIRIRPEVYTASFAILTTEILAVLEQLRRWLRASDERANSSEPVSDT